MIYDQYLDQFLKHFCEVHSEELPCVVCAKEKRIREHNERLLREHEVRPIRRPKVLEQK